MVPPRFGHVAGAGTRAAVSQSTAQGHPGAGKAMCSCAHLFQCGLKASKATDPLTIDKDLRHLAHIGVQQIELCAFGIVIKIDFSKLQTLGLEQGLGAHAVGALRLGVHGDLHNHSPVALCR